MTDKESTEPTELRPLEKTHPHLKDFMRFLPELNRKSDRGRVLISCSYLDDLLRQTLVAFFVDDERSGKLVSGFSAPLGTFSTRITAAFALGLITDREYRELETLRKIRNAFAHSIHVSFGDQSISNLCANLTYAAASYGEVIVAARGQYTTAATALILNLVNRPHYLGRSRRKAGDWPY